jgi:hypothetical protein
MTDFTKHNAVLVDLGAIQDAETDVREASREAQLFLHKRDGQWEPDVLVNEDKPRYTFDMTGPLIDQIAGEIENSEFGIRAQPAGGGATKEKAKLLDGMIRNIENMSGADDVYSQAARYMVEGGLDGWEVKQKFVDGDSFDQDLIIDPISNFTDSVWFWPFKRPDASDSPACVKLEAISDQEYDKRWPKGSRQSVDSSRLSDAYFHKNEHIVVGQLYYVKKVQRELLRLSDGRVVDAKQVASVLDDLALQGIVVEQRRKREESVVFSRLFDGSDWLNKAQKTVFNRLPIVPVIANFTNIEYKNVWRGATEKLMDPQRVFNYAKSREVEEGALAPREKVWMTMEQAAGHQDTLATLNTNSDAYQLYNPDPKAKTPPTKMNGATINPGLKTLSDDMTGMMRHTAGQYAASVGDNPNVQSGIAIMKLQDKGRLGSSKYFKAMKRGIRATGRILIDAIPKVYDTRRQVRIMNEDGSFEMAILNQTVFDQQTGQIVMVNDLSAGKYDITIMAGPSFRNRQQETVATIVDIGTVDPTFIELGGDILANNITAPGMELLAARKRQQLFQAGAIPAEQQTEEERAIVQKQQETPPPPDPALVLAEAEASKAEAQNNRVIVQAQSQQRQEDRKDQQLQFTQQAQRFDQFMAQQQLLTDQLTAQAENMETLSKAFGTENIQGGLPALFQQIQLVLEAQDAQ